MNDFNKMCAYLELMRRKYGLHVCIKDFCGFIPINKELDVALQPYLAHTNPYCMYIKHDRDRYYTCLSLIRRMYHKCEETREPFFGMCHAGLGEYVVSIGDEKMLLGCINVGFFQTRELTTEKLLERTCAKSQILDVDVAKGLYRQSISTSTVDVEDMLANMELLAEYLLHTYKLMQDTHAKITGDKLRSQSNEDSIITHAIEYIKCNYASKIVLGELAAFCHCSESYLSRIFKKRTGVNLNIYINKVRVEHAKNYLSLSGDTVAEIAARVGFDDPNYFSRVFTALYGNPPTEYRRRFHGSVKLEEIELLGDKPLAL